MSYKTVENEVSAQADLTVHAKNYLEFQNDSIAYGYYFTDNRCSEALITMPCYRYDQFITLHPYWQATGQGWIYYSDTFGTNMLISCNNDSITSTFIYKLQAR